MDLRFQNTTTTTINIVTQNTINDRKLLLPQPSRYPHDHYPFRTTCISPNMYDIEAMPSSYTQHSVNRLGHPYNSLPYPVSSPPGDQRIHWQYSSDMYVSGHSLHSVAHHQQKLTQQLHHEQQQMYDMASTSTSPSRIPNLPPKGKIHSLICEESRGIPIPGRTQSHDDIHQLGGNSPRSPGSGRYSPSKFIICRGTPNSPPIVHYDQPMMNENNIAIRSNSQTILPLSSSVPIGGGCVGIHRLALMQSKISILQGDSM